MSMAASYGWPQQHLTECNNPKPRDPDVIKDYAFKPTKILHGICPKGGVPRIRTPDVDPSLSFW